MDIYPETATQKDQSIQGNKFLALSSSKQSLPAPTPEVTISLVMMTQCNVNMVV